MTKILYIPNGEYLKFFSGRGWEATITDLEEVGEFDDSFLPPFTLDNILIYLNNTSEVCREWYDINLLENDHIFFEAELEIVYA